MDFGYDETTLELKSKLEVFMNDYIYPAETVAHEQATQGGRFDRPPVMANLQAEARRQGLWNLFLTHDDRGPGLTNLQYAPLAEITGRSPHLAPEALNCAAPDTGNMEVLARFGTPEQQQQWLEPLLEATIRSAFCMTEPAVASSDAHNIAMQIRRDGDEYIIDGRKWWSTGAMSPTCQIFIVMGETDPNAEPGKRQSMVLVPRDTPGVTVLRPMMVFGYDDGAHGGHAEIVFDSVRVPVSNLIGTLGSGFAIAQARLGPGRIHHCMRLIGMAERAVQLMCSRAVARETFGRPIADHGIVQHWIAQSRVRIEATRLLVLKTAWLMDTVGNKGAHTEIQSIKIATPAMATWVIDKAIQVHGAGGLCQDFPLAELYAGARGLRFADGPDEVHEASLARRELRPYRNN